MTAQRTTQEKTQW